MLLPPVLRIFAEGALELPPSSSMMGESCKSSLDAIESFELKLGLGVLTPACLARVGLVSDEGGFDVKSGPVGSLVVVPNEQFGAPKKHPLGLSSVLFGAKPESGPTADGGIAGANNWAAVDVGVMIDVGLIASMLGSEFKTGIAAIEGELVGSSVRFDSPASDVDVADTVGSL